MPTTLTKIQWLTLALLVSLGSNLYAASYMMGHRTHQHVAMNNMARKQVDAFLGKLPHERQAILRNHLRDNTEKFRSQLKSARQDREALTQLLTAQTLDKEAINAQFARMRENTLVSQQQLQQMMLDAFEQMSPDERQLAAEHFGAADKK